MKLNRPPVPKFNEGCTTPKQQGSLLEEVQNLIFQMNLDIQIEKQAIRILKTCKLPNTYYSAQGLVYYCLKENKQNVPPHDKKTEYVIKYIDAQQSTQIESLCSKLKFNQKITNVCVTLHRQLQFLISKLPIQLQNALSVKIAADIVFFKQGGLNNKFLAHHSKISEEQLLNAINRTKPFAEKIMTDLFSYYNTNPL